MGRNVSVDVCRMVVFVTVGEECSSCRLLVISGTPGLEISASRVSYTFFYKSV